MADQKLSPEEERDFARTQRLAQRLLIFLMSAVPDGMPLPDIFSTMFFACYSVASRYSFPQENLDRIWATCRESAAEVFQLVPVPEPLSATERERATVTNRCALHNTPIPPGALGCPTCAKEATAALAPAPGSVPGQGEEQ